MNRKNEPAARLLDWYDRNARSLPWRTGPAERKAGARPDPYRVWLSEVMLQQTTVAAVQPRFERFLERWPTVDMLAAAPLDAVLGEWAGLGYYARARNLHACAIAIAAVHNGRFPQDLASLRSLPGVGDYTAAAIAAIAFDQRAIVVDGNVERVMSRLFALEEAKPALKREAARVADAIWPQARSGDFAQALMDLGATICKPRAPECGRCPLAASCCARALGDPARFPLKPEKAARPQRYGIAYVLFDRSGRVLVERRPDGGLLGGMNGLPGGPWMEGAALEAPPAATGWTEAGVIDHVFTHFRLSLAVKAGAAPPRFRPRANMRFADPAEVRLPTVMRKALDRALGAREGGAA